MLSAGLSEFHVFETDGSGGSNRSSALLNLVHVWVWKSSGHGVLAVPWSRAGPPEPGGRPACQPLPDPAL